MIKPYKRYLLTPGPTPVPEDVLLAGAQPIIHHRTDEFKEIFKSVGEDLKYVFQTKNPVFIFASSGTGAMESAVANLACEDICFLPIVGGKFGERWLEICRAYGVEYEVLESEWGNSLDIKILENKLKEKRNIKVILATLCETSTAVTYDIKTMAKIAKKYQALLVVDAISGLLADEMKMDDWAIDFVVAGSQKGLMLPPGLAFVSLSENAWKYVEKSETPKYYFDLKKVRDCYAKIDTPYTPAVSLIVALKKSLDMIKDEGIENIWRRHSKLARICREAINAMGLKLFSKSPSNAVTAVVSPQGLDSAEFVKFIRKEFGISIAGGQGKLKGKIFRIAHLGYINIFDLLVGIAGVEFALHNFGCKFNLGKGILKLEEEFLKEIKSSAH